MNTLEIPLLALGFALLIAGSPAPAQALPDGPGKAGGGVIVRRLP